MKTDKYTKFLLTVIALCLTILTFKNIDFIPKAHASEKITNDKADIMDEKNYAIVPLNSDGSIDVNVKSFSSIMDVNIEEIGGGYVSYGGPISVEID